MRKFWRSRDDSDLEGIVGHINNKGSSLPHKVRKVPYMALAIWYKGMLGRKSQNEFSEKISWKEKNLTTANALIFGLGLSALSYYGGEAVGHLEKMDFIKNLEGHLAFQVANIFGTTSKNVLYTYSGFNVAQSLFRIGYSQLTGKAIPSFCVMGAFANVFNAADSYLRRNTK